MLAQMNEQLIRDEGHRSHMTRRDLEPRTSQWLAEGYSAVLFEADERVAGYALYREETECVYLKQFFVASEYRRAGIGRSAMQWLMTNPWKGQARIRIDVLVGNAVAIAFWRSSAFKDYCVTMEMDLAERRDPR